MQNLFSYPITVDDLSSSEKKYTIEADDKQKAFVKEVLKVEDIESLKSVLLLKFDKKEHAIGLKGEISAKIELKSVISLDTFVKNYNIAFTMTFDTWMNAKEQRKLEEEGEDAPDILNDGKLDLGDIIIEQIALNLEDYPRIEGETFEFKPEFTDEPVKKSPFEALSKLKSS